MLLVSLVVVVLYPHHSYLLPPLPQAAQNSEGNDADEGFDGWDSDDSEEEVVVQQALKAPSATGEDIRFIGNHVRGSGYIFGGAAAEPFLMDNRFFFFFFLQQPCFFKFF